MIALVVATVKGEAGTPQFAVIKWAVRRASFFLQRLVVFRVFSQPFIITQQQDTEVVCML